MKSASSPPGASSFERLSGQRSTSISPTRSDSTINSTTETEPVFESPPSQDNPFKTAFDTPQSSVVNVVLRRPAQQVRVAKFFECACVNGGLCVGAGGGATCDCDVVPPQVPETESKADKAKSFRKKASSSISKVFKKSWKSCTKL